MYSKSNLTVLMQSNGFRDVERCNALFDDWYSRLILSNLIGYRDKSFGTKKKLEF